MTIGPYQASAKILCRVLLRVEGSSQASGDAGGSHPSSQERKRVRRRARSVRKRKGGELRLSAAHNTHGVQPRLYGAVGTQRSGHPVGDGTQSGTARSVKWV